MILDIFSLSTTKNCHPADAWGQSLPRKSKCWIVLYLFPSDRWISWIEFFSLFLPPLPPFPLPPFPFPSLPCCCVWYMFIMWPQSNVPSGNWIKDSDSDSDFEMGQLNSPISSVLCPECQKNSVSVMLGNAKMGFSHEMTLLCTNCGKLKCVHTSPRIRRSADQTVGFEVNHLAVLYTHE